MKRLIILLTLGVAGCGGQDLPAVSVVKLEETGAEIVRDSRGKVLEISLRADATDDELQLLSELTGLENLNLSGTKVSDSGLEHLTGMSNLKALRLSITRVSDSGLLHLHRLTQLQSLDLSGLQITDAGLRNLEELRELRSLDISGTRVTGAGLAHLAGLTSLERLVLSGTGVGDDGLKHLVRLTRLESLDLSGTQVTGSGLEHLAGLTNLRDLAVGFTRVCDTGLMHLKNLDRLESLNVDRSQVTSTGVNALREVLPTCSIVGRGKLAVTESKPDRKRDSHQRMLAVLREVDARTADEHPYLGDGQLRQLAQQLNSLPFNAPVSVRVKAMFQLAESQLKAGQTEQAVEQLMQCSALLQEEKTMPNVAQIRSFLDKRIAVAYLRLAENRNCVHCRDEDCCIFPIQGGGVHRNKQPARNAVKHLTQCLERNGGDVTAIWLLNVAYMALGEYPDAVPPEWLISEEQYAPRQDFPKFSNIALKLGLNTFSLCGGMIVDDLNGDRWLDVVTSSWDTSGQMRCWLNNGDGTFTENTEEAGLIGLFGGLNMIQADYDNDGDVDILVLRGAWLKQFGHHPNSLLQNDGHGRFRDVTFDAGLGESYYPTQSAAWADYDNDGDLDLYVANEIGDSELFNNDGLGHFANVARHAGVTGGRYPKGVVWGDYDNDRYPDLYVSNLKGANFLYHNNRDGTFTDVASKTGVQEPTRSFPAWFWDFNNDGALDLFVAAYWADVNNFAADYLGRTHRAGTDRLYQGDGKGAFHDVTTAMGLANVTLPMGSNFGDVNNDGFLDFYLGTGYPDYAGLMPNRMFRNHQGARFEDVTAAAGLGHLQKGHGVAFADYDHDGDQDIFIEMGGAFPGDAFSDAVFENPGFGNHWVVVRLNGRESNRAGIGARIRAEVTEDGKSRSIYKWVNSGGTFGGSPLRQHIGLGAATRIDRLEIYWPTTDLTQAFTDLEVDRMIVIVEGQEDFQQILLRPAPGSVADAAVAP